MNKGDRIKIKREELGKTQTDLAKNVGISKQTLYKYENNIVTNIPSNIIEKLSYYLNCTPSYLMGWEDKEESEHHYIDEKTRQIAQEIADNKELGLLFDAARTAAPEDLKTTHDMLLALKRKETGNTEEPC